MVAITPETGDTCTEEGELTVDEASEAQLTGGDYTNTQKTEMCPIVQQVQTKLKPNDSKGSNSKGSDSKSSTSKGNKSKGSNSKSSNSKGNNSKVDSFRFQDLDL